MSSTGRPLLYNSAQAFQNALQCCENVLIVQKDLQLNDEAYREMNRILDLASYCLICVELLAAFRAGESYREWLQNHSLYQRQYESL